jgi:dsDNA-binding SOS-regulon protein
MNDIQQLEELRDSATTMLEARDLLYELLDGPVRMRTSSDEELHWWIDRSKDVNDRAVNLGALLASGELLDEPASVQLLTDQANGITDLFLFIFQQLRQRLLELAQTN